jgi:gamma-glutamyltranspeptidase/glutathione hydrolase
MFLAILVATAAVSAHGAVAAANPSAAEAGASVLRSGGNAVDAAVAAAFALNVVEPQSSGIGGGGFALVYVAREKKVHVIDFREAAPLKARPDMFIIDGKPRQDLSDAGPLSIAVPSAALGYAELAKRFGTKPLAQLTAPAERLATNGFQVSVTFRRAQESRRDCLAQDPEAARIFLRDGKPLEPGDRLVNRDLARTLHAIGQRGPAAFYTGRIARSILDTKGVLITPDDLAKVRVREREPIVSSYRGHQIVAMPLPSSGGFIVAGLLNVLELESASGSYRSDRFFHVVAETEKRLFALRQKLGDPAFNPGSDERVRTMSRKEFAKELHGQIGERATPATQLVQQPEHGTTSLAVIDAEGNAVALSTTVNDSFGSCIVAKGAGFILNDQMDDFAIAPGVPNAYGLRGDAENAPGPGKQPLSSMAPTLVFSPDGRIELALGAAGGATIPTSVAQAIQHVIDDDMAIDRAIEQPRVHHNLFPDVLHVEPHGMDADTVQALVARGHQVDFGKEPYVEHPRGLFGTVWGKTCGVQVDRDTGWRVAACDPRQDGGAAVP